MANSSPAFGGCAKAAIASALLIATLACSAAGSAADPCDPCASPASAAEPRRSPPGEPTDADREAYVRSAVRGPQLPPAAAGKHQGGSGSGFFVNERDILTNHHVVKECSGLTVRIGGAREWVGASLLASDAARDLAVLRAEASVARGAVLMDPSAAAAPEHVTIIGYPELPRVVIIPVAMPATVERRDLWGTNAAFLLYAVVRPGHSGSAVINKDGAVVGMLTKRVNPLSRYRQTGRVDDKDIGIAISAPVLEQFLRAKAIPYTLWTPGRRPADPLLMAQHVAAQVGCWK